MMQGFDENAIRQLLVGYTLWADTTGYLDRYMKEAADVDDPSDLAESLAQAFIATLTARIALAGMQGES